jgi:hypothetical protein
MHPEFFPKCTWTKRRGSLEASDGDFSISFSWRGDAMEALSKISKEKEVSPILVFAFYAAVRALKAGKGEKEIGLSSSLFSSLLLPQTSLLLSKGRRLSKRERKMEFLRIKREIMEGASFVALMGDAYSSCCCLWRIGRAFWKLEEIEFALRAVRQAARVGGIWPAFLASSIAVAEMEGEIECFPGRFRAPSLGAIFTAWPFYLSLFGMSEEVARALFPSLEIPSPGDWPIEEPPGAPPPEGLPDPLLLWGLRRNLLQEAEGGRYVPLGFFELKIPSSLPLPSWGVESLRLFCEPDGIWFSIILPDGKVCFPGRWTPEEGIHLSSLLFPGWSVPSLELLFASIWRDLRVEAEEAFPERRRRGRKPEGGKVAPKHPSTPQRKGVTVFPRRVRVEGRRDWGNEEERRRVSAHFVRPHYRKWKPSSNARKSYVEQVKRRAAIRAELYGCVPPPDGYTFVRPHARGGGREEREKLEEGIEFGEIRGPRKIRARGLLSLFAVFSTKAN